MFKTVAKKKKTTGFLLIPTLVFLLVLQLLPPVFAAGNSSDFMSVSEYKSYNQDGQFYMSYMLKNTSVRSDRVAFHAKLVNSAGKTVFTWNEKEYAQGQGGRRNFGANYAKLPTGAYTFILTGRVTYNSMDSINRPSWSWKYKINHKSGSKLSFNGYEKMRDDKGAELHKFTLGYTGGAGKNVVMRIFDSNGTLVTLIEGKTITQDSGSRIFKWDGNSDIGGGYRCKSGQYTVQIYFSGDKEVVEKTYDLKIF